MREIKCKSMTEWLDKLNGNLSEDVKPCVQAHKLRFGFTVSKHKNKIGYFCGLPALKDHADNIRRQRKILKCFGKKCKTTDDRIENVIEFLKETK